IETQEKMQEFFPDTGDATSAHSGTVVVQAGEGETLTDPEVMAEVDQLIGELQDTGALADAESLVNPVLAAQGMSAQMTEQMAAQGMPEQQMASNLAAVTPLSED